MSRFPKKFYEKRIVHWGKGNRDYSKKETEFRSHCIDGRMVEDDKNTLTYSLENITCKLCLEKYIEMKRKELLKAEQLLNYA